MSNGINDNSAKRQQGQAQQQQNEQQQQNHQGRARHTESRSTARAALSSMSGQFSGRVIGRNSNAALSAFAEHASNLLNNLGKNVGTTFDVFTLQPGDHPDVSVPVAVTLGLCAGMRAYYITVVEPGTTRPEDDPRQEGNESYRIFMSSGEAITQDLMHAVEDHLAKVTGTSSNDLLCAGASVYYRENSMDDSRMLDTYCQQAIGVAITTAFVIEEGIEEDTRLTDYDMSAERLILRASMPDHHDLDAAGIPIRNDIVMGLFVQPRQHDSRSRDAEPTSPEYNNLTPLVAASMYTDLMYDPREVEVKSGRRQGSSEWLDTTYTPVVVITDLMAPKQTPNQLLLALGIAFGVRTKGTYLAGLDPRAVSAEMADLRNIGAMQIDIGAENSADGEFGQGFDANDLERYTVADHREFIRQNINDDVMFAMEIPEHGASTWYLEQFALAGEGDQKARQALLDAADNLTGGKFNKLYKDNGGTGAVMHVQEMRYVRGFYHNKNGMRRSSADIDNVARFNILGPTNPQMARLAESVEIDTSRSQYYRSAFMHKVVSACKNVQPIGYSLRYHIESAFIVSLAEAIIECGVRPELNAPYAESSSDRRMSGSRFSNFAGVGRDVNVSMGEVRGIGRRGDSGRFRSAFNRNRDY